MRIAPGYSSLLRKFIPDIVFIKKFSLRQFLDICRATKFELFGLILIPMKKADLGNIRGWRKVISFTDTNISGIKRLSRAQIDFALERGAKKEY